VLTGIGAPTAWPFFHPDHPTVPIRQALGTAIDSGFPTVQVDGINLATGDLLLCATASDNAGSATTVACSIGADAMTQIVSVVSNVTLLVTIHSFVAAAPAIGKTCLARWTVNDPDNQCMLVTKVSNIAGVLFDARTITYLSQANPDTGYGGNNVPRTFYWGIVGLIGRQADALGAWQNGMVAGQRIGSADVGPRIDLKEGWEVSPIFPRARTRILGQTARQCAAVALNYT
jgi:hypothetical protein